MIAAARQLQLIDTDEDAEIEAGYVWREVLYSACRACVRELGGYTATEWAPARPGSEHLLIAEDAK